MKSDYMKILILKRLTQQKQKPFPNFLKKETYQY